VKAAATPVRGKRKIARFTMVFVRLRPFDVSLVDGVDFAVAASERVD
jgi:hypothetical protein